MSSQITQEIVESLRNQILSKHKSIRSFCQENNMCRHNLSKIFQGRQEISIGLFVRINIALGVLCPEHNKYGNLNDITLNDFMQIDSMAIHNAVIHHIRHS